MLRHGNNQGDFGRGRRLLLVAAAAAVLVALAGLAGSSPLSAQTAEREADLAVSKSDSPDPVFENQSMTYTITVVNRGPNAAGGVKVTDKLPRRFVATSATASSGTCKVTGRTVFCNIGRLTVGTGATIGTVTITGTPTRAGRIVNSVTVRSNVRDPRPANDLATEATRVRNLRRPTCQGEDVTLLGTTGSDRLIGTTGNDVVLAWGGDDVIFTFRGHDLICAGRGNDRVRAGIWADRVFGNSGDDRLDGGGGHDRIKGNRDRDRLFGRAGNDLLNGGANFDVCKGGRGRDVLRRCERR